MELTKAERLILLNQYTILQKQDKDNKRDYDFHIKVLLNGFEQEYPNLDESIGWSKPFKEVESKLVWSVLDMYEAIEDFKSNASAKDVEEIEDNIFGEFVGFDGNEEIEYLNYCNFIILVKKRYQNFRTQTDASLEDFNSHMNTIYSYEKKLKEFNKYDRKTWTKKDVLATVTA